AERIAPLSPLRRSCSLASDRTSSALTRRCLLPGRRRNADVPFATQPGDNDQSDHAHQVTRRDLVLATVPCRGTARSGHPLPRRVLRFTRCPAIANLLSRSRLRRQPAVHRRAQASLLLPVLWPSRSTRSAWRRSVGRTRWTVGWPERRRWGP